MLSEEDKKISMKRGKKEIKTGIVIVKRLGG